jgi:hypothetical protein
MCWGRYICTHRQAQDVTLAVFDLACEDRRVVSFDSFCMKMFFHVSHMNYNLQKGSFTTVMVMNMNKGSKDSWSALILVYS